MNVTTSSEAGEGCVGHSVQDIPSSSSPANIVVWKVTSDRDWHDCVRQLYTRIPPGPELMHSACQELAPAPFFSHCLPLRHAHMQASL